MCSCNASCVIWSNTEMQRTDSEYRAALQDAFDLAVVMVDSRKRAGLTQKDVAEGMGISQPAVAKIESGRSLNVNTPRRYAAATGTSPRATFEAMR
jgi:DNA-binding XRE family transcriptional regulator